MPKYYEKAEVFLNGDPDYVVFWLGPASTNGEPAELRDIKERIERTGRVIGALYMDDEVHREKRLNFLRGIAAHLCQEIDEKKKKNQASERTLQLDAFEKIIVEEGVSKWLPKYRSMLQATAWGFSVVGLAALLLRLFDPGIRGALSSYKSAITTCNIAMPISAFLLVISGALAGLWLNTRTRFERINMDTITTFDPNRLSLGVRLTTTIFWSLIVAIIIYSNIVKFGIFNENFNDFESPGHWAVAFVLGVVISMYDADLFLKIKMTFGRLLKTSDQSTSGNR